MAKKISRRVQHENLPLKDDSSKDKSRIEVLFEQVGFYIIQHEQKLFEMCPISHVYLVLNCL